MDFEDRDTGRYVKRVEDRFKHIEEAHNRLVKGVNDYSRREEARRHMEHLQNQRDNIREAHERGQAYTNIILTVGYAGFFALWTITKDYQWPRLHALALLCIAASLTCFVGWEILQAAMRSALPKEPEKLTVGEDRKKRWYDHSNLVKVWACFFIPSVVTGLAAGALLMWVLIAHATEVFRTAPAPAIAAPSPPA